MKHKTTFVTALIFGLILLALVSRKGEILVMALPLLLYLGTGVLSAPGKADLAAVREVERQAENGSKTVLVKVGLKNRGGALHNVFVSDRQHEQRLAIPAGGEAIMDYSFPAQRGLFSWDVVRASVSDPFGLLAIQKDIPAPGEILIQPEYERLAHYPLKPQNTLHSAGLVPAGRGGSGLNFWGVREYQLGDSMRWLNWKTIARNPRKLYTTEFEHEEIMEIGLVLDARLQTETVSGGSSLFEHSMSAAMSLSELFLREGNRVGLLIFGQNMTPLAPGYGKRQLLRMFTALSDASVTANFSLVYLEYVQKRLFSSRALIVMISPLGLHDLQTYKNLRAYGYQILLVSPDPVSFHAQHAPRDPMLDLALRTARIERYAQLKQLLQLGVKVVDWQVQRPLSETLNGVFLPRGNGAFYA